MALQTQWQGNLCKFAIFGYHNRKGWTGVGNDCRFAETGNVASMVNVGIRLRIRNTISMKVVPYLDQIHEQA
jgi:hypothetical protein